MSTEKVMISDCPHGLIRVSFFDKNSSILLPILLFFIDYLAIVLALGGAYWLRKWVIPLFYSDFSIPKTYLVVIVPMIFLAFLHFDQMYIRRMPFWQMSEKLFKSSTYAVLTVIVLMYFGGVAKEVSRIFVFLIWICTFLSLVCFRYLLKKFLNASGLLQIPVVLVGAGKTAELLIKSFTEDAGLGYKIIGIIEDHPHLSPIKGRYPILGTFDNAEQAVKRSGAQNVIIAAPGLDRDKLLNLIYRLQPLVRKVAFVPDLFGVPVSSMELETLFYEKTVMLKVRNNLSLWGNRLLKCILERIIGTILCILLLPLMAIIAIFIKFETKGSAFYLGSRLGEKGKTFICYKFRTMYNNSDDILGEYLESNLEAKIEWEQYAKLRKFDPRVTTIGRFLRKYSLDELPQIINVIKGDMSLVGPRPYLVSERHRMGIYKDTILTTTPGITGLWQVSGRNEIDFDGRLNLDCWYVRNWSIWLDLTILIKTIKVVLVKKGAY